MNPKDSDNFADRWFDDRAGWGTGSSGWTGPTERCFHSHQPLALGSTGWQVWGGSCSAPVIDDADVYIGFDRGMRHTSRGLPWKPGWEVAFPITDQCAPRNAGDFVKLVEWAAERLAEGKKLHAGCIGGHGRTGMFLAALVKVTTGEADAIAYVRKHYCKKAVETKEQVMFLVQHFGIAEAPARYTGGTGAVLVPKGHGGGHHQRDLLIPTSHQLAPPAPTVQRTVGLGSSRTLVTPVKHPGCIWGR